MKNSMQKYWVLYLSVALSFSAMPSVMANPINFQGQNPALFPGANPNNSAAMLATVQKKNAPVSKTSSISESQFILQSVESQASNQITTALFKGGFSTTLSDGTFMKSVIDPISGDLILTIQLLGQAPSVIDIGKPSS